MKDEQKTYILHGHAEKVIHGKNGYCGIYVPIKRYQNGSFQTVWYLAYMKITNKEHVYPLIPFLTTGYIIILIILTVQGQSISWLL